MMAAVHLIRNADRHAGITADGGVQQRDGLHNAGHHHRALDGDQRDAVALDEVLAHVLQFKYHMSAIPDAVLAIIILDSEEWLCSAN